MADESEFPRAGSSTSNGTERAWSVEARHTHDPAKIGDQIFDSKWRRVNFASSPVGVPIAYSSSGYDRHGLLSYQTAQALRWWLKAEAAKTHLICLDTRLIEHEIKYSYAETAVGTHEVLEGNLPFPRKDTPQ